MIKIPEAVSPRDRGDIGTELTNGMIGLGKMDIHQQEMKDAYFFIEYT